MPFRKIEEEQLACAFNKIDNRKIRRICHQENLENRKREQEIHSNNIPKDRRLERVQIANRLAKKLEKKKQEKECWCGFRYPSGEPLQELKKLNPEGLQSQLDLLKILHMRSHCQLLTA